MALRIGRNLRVRRSQLALVVLTGTFAMALAGCPAASTLHPPSTTSTAVGRTLAIPLTVEGRCASGVCQLQVPSTLRQPPLRFPVVAKGASCPASTGEPVTHPGMGGVALGEGEVTVTTNGLKADWVISPSYAGWVIVRAKRLDGDGPTAALGEATAGPVVIPRGPTSNTFAGWRGQPSGTYVKGPGCYGFQVDGSSFREEIVVEAILPTGSQWHP